ERPFVMPEKCPVCGSRVEHPQDEVMTYCPNVSCPGRGLAGIVYFASRGALDIRGLGYARVRALLDAGFFENVADLYDRDRARLEKLGLTMTEPSAAAGEGGGPLAGQTYVITGTLPSLSRTKAQELIEAAGGHVTDNVSKKTTAVVMGADDGSKLEKARALRV